MSFQRANKGPKVIDRLRKKLCEQESLLLLMSPSMHLRVHNKNGKVTAVIIIVCIINNILLSMNVENLLFLLSLYLHLVIQGTNRSNVHQTKISYILDLTQAGLGLPHPTLKSNS